jgi:hypothetical protein
LQFATFTWSSETDLHFATLAGAARLICDSRRSRGAGRLSCSSRRSPCSPPGWPSASRARVCVGGSHLVQGCPVCQSTLIVQSAEICQCRLVEGSAESASLARPAGLRPAGLALALAHRTNPGMPDLSVHADRSSLLKSASAGWCKGLLNHPSSSPGWPSANRARVCVCVGATDEPRDAPFVSPRCSFHSAEICQC